MKAYLVLCILFASILFFPSSLLARELAAGGGTGGTGGTTNPGKPAKPCGKQNPGAPYCGGAKPNPRPCGKYNRRNCPPNTAP